MQCHLTHIGIDYPTQLSIFTHHMWIGAFCVVGAGAHAQFLWFVITTGTNRITIY